MIKDYIKEYYLDKSVGCAESMLRTVARAYDLKLDESNYMAMGAFGGGVSCKHLCGAISGGVAAIGTLLYKGDEESLKTAKAATVEFFERMKKSFGTVICEDIMKDWRRDDTRCFEVVKKAAEILDDILYDKYTPQKL